MDLSEALERISRLEKKLAARVGDLEADLAASRFSEREWRDKAHDKIAESEELEARAQRAEDAFRTQRSVSERYREALERIADDKWPGPYEDERTWGDLVWEAWNIARAALSTQCPTCGSAELDGPRYEYPCGDPFHSTSDPKLCAVTDHDLRVCSLPAGHGTGHDWEFCHILSDPKEE